MSNSSGKSEDRNAAEESSAKATGIGGIFFYSENPNELKEWYAKNLGFNFSEWGSSSFESRAIDNPEVINTLEWYLFKKESEHFAPSKKDFMINYRVQHLEQLVDRLRENGVTILDEIAQYDYGKFVHILDHEGNKLELWEPSAGG